MTRTNRWTMFVLGFALFFGWLWSGWQYLKHHVPFKIWEGTVVKACAEG